MTQRHSLRLILPLLALLCAPAAHALPSPDELPVDARIKLLAYDANDIYTVTTRVGYQTNIEFSPKEEIQTISVGDRSYWQLVPSGNRLFIRPLDSGASTNMTLITNRRTYQFDLKSVNAKTPITYVIRFTYPEDEPRLPPVAYEAPVAAAPVMPVAMPAPAPAPAPVMASPAAPQSPRNYLYTYSGPESAAPFEVFDDGTATYFRYQDTTRPAPAAAKIEGGKESPVGIHRRGDYFVADAVAPELVLRGNGTVHVYNEKLSMRP